MKEDKNNSSSVMMCGVEFASAVIVGAVIGILLDNYFDKFPLFLIISFVLGSIAGYFNVVRYTDFMK